MANKSNGYYLQLRNAMHRCMKPVNRKLNMTSNGQYLCEQVWIRLRQYENGKIKMGEALFHNGGGGCSGTEIAYRKKLSGILHQMLIEFPNCSHSNYGKSKEYNNMDVRFRLI